MRRVFLLAFLLVLAIGAIAPVEVAAADGAESSESLTVFSETTSDDVPLWSDSPMAEKNKELANWHANQQATDNWSVVLTSGAGSEGSASDGDVCELWHTRDEAGWVIGGSTDPFSPAVTYGNDYWAFLKIQASDPTTTVRIIFVWEDVGYYMDYGPSETISDSDCHIISAPMDDYTGGHDLVGVGVRFTGDGSSNVSLSVDWVHVLSGYPEDSASVYSEPFLDVSDWTTLNIEAGDTFTSDGDLGNFEVAGASESDYVYSDSPSITVSGAYYVELRYSVNVSDGYSLRLNLYTQDAGAGTSQTIVLSKLETTKKSIITLSTVESVMLIVDHAGSSVGRKLSSDYLRIGPADEMGWQHDGSTTAGITDDGGAGKTFTYSSDGDILTLNVTHSASPTGNTYVYLSTDTTATISQVERDYYPFVELRYKISSSSTMTPALVWCSDGYYSEFSTVVDGAWHTLRLNHKASTSGRAGSYFYIYSYAYASKTFEVELDWVKAYSIANFTLTMSAQIDTYVYVDDSNDLQYVQGASGDNYIQLDHDPIISVSTTYPVWNITTGGYDMFYFKVQDTVSSIWYYMVTSGTDTRGALPSGGIKDFYLLFHSDTTDSYISAIKFIEDGTAPVVVRSSSTPNDPEDDESTTLSAVITDTVEVYSVAFNAIVYPTGFSDVDYSANEQADNLWNYTFSSLDAGYYCFKIIASDGANTNALTEYAYIEITVREAAIRVEEITLIGAGSDFTMMTFSARINRDCSFTIYEESASSPESDTHTGSVTAPSFNLAWTKLDVDDANVNFTIKFTSGSLTYNYTSQYQVAQTTFYVSTVTQMVSLDTVTVTGRITKLGAYQVYDDLDVLKDYGSITDLDFKIQFTRWGGYDEQNHDFAIKFTNGTQTCWYNSSFYAFKKPVVAAFQTTDPNVLYAFQASFWTAVAATFILIMVAIDFYRRYWKD